MRAEASELDRLLAGIRGCRNCVETPSGKPLPHEPRPVLRVSETARLAVCSQAPGTRVHASGISFTDPSGDRLRDWMGVSPQEFYDERRVAIIPMGFCFPGQDANGGDLPPRAECAKLWHRSLFDRLPRLELVLAVGSYSQAWHLGSEAGPSLQATVLDWRRHLRRRRRPRILPLPHPSWRNNAWLTRNPWFEEELLPVLRREVRKLL
jgi:uracil-DNA glycosylase